MKFDSGPWFRKMWSKTEKKNILSITGLNGLSLFNRMLTSNVLGVRLTSQTGSESQYKFYLEDLAKYQDQVIRECGLR